MTLYAETSAVLAWLLGEAAAAEVRHELGAAGEVFTSVLTLVESDRVLIRAQVVDGLAEGDVVDRRRALARAGRHWHLVQLHEEILDRARRPFPGEPVRTLDALHLASALAVRAAVPDVVILSLDDDIRRAGADLGFVIAPVDSPS
ncbi:MAG: PIN domain-containing protein [Armatimonadota bacterium]|nr:PIN domain-containing protein [Armatimonadota bacterium]MDR7453148.1 PIN domain-containing protein [Armatimonadota bacterium]MDR7458122.1 PIN domain-containing protein [Armatimonadota bacterium]MDR7496000.1 PIN domain-containing protein [Armatimonadota bacterium]MDR7510899.1 PIN domain-containing protein [Armatimonadota bacterium]